MMLHRLLQLDRPLFILDVETIGLDTRATRVVELGFQQWTAEGLVKEWRSLIDPGVPIPPEATRVHGITDESFRRCQACGEPRDHHEHGNHDFKVVPSFGQIAPSLAKGFADCDYAGKNVRFDLRVLSAEFARAGVAWSCVGARIVDADRLEQLAVPRSLSHLHEKYVGMKHDGAHSALGDVRASATVIAHQLRAHPTLPRSLDLLHRAQFPGMIDLEGKFKFVGGVACCAFGKWAGRPMREVEPSYWDWILKGDFSADVKELVLQAKLGRFPEER